MFRFTASFFFYIFSHSLRFFSELKETGIDGCGAQAHPRLTENFVNSLTSIDKKVHVWTVDQPEQAKRYAELGLSSITTNKPGQIKNWLLAS